MTHGSYGAILHYRDETMGGASVHRRESLEQARADALDAVGLPDVTPDARLVVWRLLPDRGSEIYGQATEIVLEIEGRDYRQTAGERRRRSLSGARAAVWRDIADQLCQSSLRDGDWHRRDAILDELGLPSVHTTVRRAVGIETQRGYLVGRRSEGSTTWWRIRARSRV